MTHQRILCLLYLLLERHSKILSIGQMRVLSNKEFETMVASIHNVNLAFGLRYHTLAEGWRQQRLDPSAHVQCFASGIFESWHQTYGDVRF
jgi:hypothetical protein